jgi:hypothetical protein
MVHHEPMTRRDERLALSSLRRGMEGLSAAKACALVEAAEVCLHHGRHGSGVRLAVTGHWQASRALEFEPPSPSALRTHADLQEATESGACALAIAVARDETGMEVVERARKGTGVDYWLGHVVGVFEARLEVSGILEGSDGQVARRARQKLDQMTRSGSSGVPGYAAVVDFASPRVHVEHA